MTKSAVKLNHKESALTNHIDKSVKTFTCNKLNISGIKKMYDEIALFIEGKTVLNFDTKRKFMNIEVTIIVENKEDALFMHKPKVNMLELVAEECSKETKSSKYRGVSWRKRDKKWRVEITAHNKRHYLGQYDSELEAANVYDRKALELLGSKAKLNFENEVILNG